MQPLLWSQDQASAFVTHPDRAVRRWAMDRLIERYPAAAPTALLPLLDDPDQLLLSRAASVIGASGDAERLRAPLVERLSSARGQRFGRMVEALARLDPDAARPVLLKRAQRGKDGLEPDELLYVANALGLVGGEAARRALWELLAAYTRDGFGAMAVVEGLLQAAEPGDIRRLVSRLRAWPVTARTWRTSLSALPAAGGAARLFEEMVAVADSGVQAMLGRAAGWLGRQPPLDDEQVRIMARAFPKQPLDMFPALLAEAVRLSQARGDDIAAWRAQWDAGERLSGYRRRAVLTHLALQAFLSPLVPHPERLIEEAVAGLALVCQLSVDEDDEGWLAATEDKTAARFDILGQDREHVLPGIVEQVAGLGPSAVPALVDLLQSDSSPWGSIRAARALASLARQHPEACQAAIPVLIERITDEYGDFSLEACSSALSAIGPAVVEPIAAALNDDMTREIYLMGVLGEIPTQRSAEIVMDRWARNPPEDHFELERLSGHLADIGSRAAIGLLAPYWEPDDAHLAEHLLVLHVINGLDHPQLPRWRNLAAAEDERIMRLTESLRFTYNDADEPLPGDSEPPRPAPAPRPETGGKKRRKRRRSGR